MFRLWPWSADEFTVYKKGGRSGHATISDRKRYLLQPLIDPYFGRQFTVMRRPLSTAIDRGALSLSKECLAPTRPARSPRKAVRSGRRDTPSDSIALLSEADLCEASHLACQMATQAFCRALQADADVVISQPGLRRGAGRCSNARWGRPCNDHRMRLCCVPGGRDRIAPSVERAGAVAPATKQSRMRTRTSPRSALGRGASSTSSPSGPPST